jgi:hypothetical protein
VAFYKEFVVSANEFFQSEGGFGKRNQIRDITAGDSFLDFNTEEGNLFGYAINAGGEVEVKLFIFFERAGIKAVLEGVLVAFGSAPPTLKLRRVNPFSLKLRRVNPFSLKLRRVNPFMLKLRRASLMTF